jgi:hypothetical protein
MENIRVNSCEKEDKRGILQGQIKNRKAESMNDVNIFIKNNLDEILKEKDEIIAELYKEIDTLINSNNELQNELNALHNETNNNSIEAEQSGESFLTGKYEGYDIKQLEEAYKLENQMAVGY